MQGGPRDNTGERRERRARESGAPARRGDLMLAGLAGLVSVLPGGCAIDEQGQTLPSRLRPEVMQFVDIAPTTTVHLRAASALAFRDFEEAMQVGAALACTAECMATRNARDFRKSPVPALTPARVIARLA